MIETDAFASSELFDIDLPQVHETRLDGVRTVWVEADMPFTAALLFRAGMADETLATRGITHLVEHLALSPLRDVTHPYNGGVTIDHTVFWAAGSTTEVTAFLREVALNLGNLPADRLELEAQVLMAEAMRDNAWVGSTILSARFGAQGPGLVAFDEYGLRRLKAGEVADWADSYFTADNAVLMLTGPPPDDLQLPLRRGDYRPLPAWVYDDLAPEATTFAEQTAGATVAVFGERTVAFRIATEVVRLRLEDRLRHDLGRVYSVAGEYQPLSTDEAFVLWGADSDPAHAVEVAETLVDSLRDIVEHGPSPSELGRAIAKTTNKALFVGDAMARGQAFLRAQELLLDHDEIDIVASLAATAELKPGDIAAALRRPFDRAMAVVPAGADIGFAPYMSQRDEPIAGHRFRAKRGKGRMVLGDEAVASQFGGTWFVLRFDRLAVSEHQGAKRRLLIDEQGAWMVFDATQWWRGDRLLAGIDAATPPNVVIPATR